MARLRWFFIASLVLFGTFCATAPRNIACTTDAECSSVDPDYTYCSQKRCVECLGDAGCGYGNRCMDGHCERKCSHVRDCRAGEACVRGRCEHD
ncbi:MAG: hypothetical protein HOW73_00065 [Polyangiaceae bacterium]|nr:hypothetical protein [Polyangiaceae bacterium]